MGEAGDRVHDHGPPPSGAKVAGLAGDLEDLGDVRKAEVVDGDGLEGAQLDAAVGAVAGAVQHGNVVPGQADAAVQQGGLVGLDREQVVSVLAGELQDLGGVREAEVADRDGLRVRISMRPWPRSRVRSATGTLCQAKAAQRSRRVGWLALTTNR